MRSTHDHNYYNVLMRIGQLMVFVGLARYVIIRRKLPIAWANYDLRTGYVLCPRIRSKMPPMVWEFFLQSRQF